MLPRQKLFLGVGLPQRAPFNERLYGRIVSSICIYQKGIIRKHIDALHCTFDYKHIAHSILIGQYKNDVISCNDGCLATGQGTFENRGEV